MTKVVNSFGLFLRVFRLDVAKVGQNISLQKAVVRTCCFYSWPRSRPEMWFSCTRAMTEGYNGYFGFWPGSLW